MNDNRTPNTVRLYHQITARQPKGQGVRNKKWKCLRHEIISKAVHQSEDYGCGPHRAAGSEESLKSLQEDTPQPQFFHEGVRSGKDQPSQDCRKERIRACEALCGEHEGGWGKEEEHKPADAHAQFQISALDED